MVGTIRLIWIDGVLTDNGKEVAGPGDPVYADHFKAEEWVRSGKARYASIRNVKER